jgi:UDP-N-acetylglucosamine 2-epimerase (hydrolysing)
MKKRVLFITATRADFGKLKPLIRAVENHQQLDAYIFVTGMHTLVRHGSTYLEIEKSGFKNQFMFFNQIASSSNEMDLILANTIQGLGHYVREFRPDLIVIHGDRIEAMAGAIVGVLNNILTAHIEGGELSGTVDDLIRHSVSKLCHLHFVANEEARLRLVQMGESSENIFIIGSPDIDIMLSENLPDIDRVKEHYEVTFDDYCIFIYHPVTTELRRMRTASETVINALVESGRNFVVIQPNNDMGSEIILESLEVIQNNPRFKVFPSVRFENFLVLLKNATAIIGNSSAGIREAPVYGVPTINVGSRQENRFSSPSIINVPEESEAILHALSNLPSTLPQCLYFGKGNSAELFIEQMNDSTLWDIKQQKQFQDLPSFTHPFSQGT